VLVWTKEPVLIAPIEAGEFEKLLGQAYRLRAGIFISKHHGPPRIEAGEIVERFLGQ